MGKFQKDFSRANPLEKVEITLDGETFYATSIAPAWAFLDVAAVNDAKDVEKIKIIMEFLDAVLDSDSAERFAARLRSSENPITVDQCSDVAIWLIEEVYVTARPTQAPSQSPNGSETTGPSSTDGAGATASTPA